MGACVPQRGTGENPSAEGRTITSMMDETRRFPPLDKFVERAHIKSLKEYKKVYEESIKNPEAFWEKQATENLEWSSTNWKKVFEWDKENARFSWFKGGKLNASSNCLDKHLTTWRKNKAALIWQGEPEGETHTYTYWKLHQEVCKFANVLKGLGVKKGDRVAIYMPMVIELPVVMLACARIGAMHSVVFGGFSAAALRDRINDSGCKLLICSNGYYRAGKTIQSKDKADEAVAECPTIDNVVVVKRLRKMDVAMVEGRDHYYHHLMKNASPDCPAEEMDAEDPLFILYTSGSTGKPKGVLHTTGGYMLYTTTTFNYIFDHQDDDTYWCTADIGWITGHSYILYGPLCAGATSIMFEGVPTYPAPDRFWQIVEKFGVNLFYTAPTAIRALIRSGEAWPGRHDLSSLRLLGTVGEPINPEAWMWYHKVIGGEKCPIVDTWWQTETGGVLITPLPGAHPTKPGSCTMPFFGIEPAILKEDGSEAKANEGGYLVIKKPWPGLMRTVFGDHQRFKDTYWSKFDGIYFSGDGARFDEDGYFWIMGRVDDVMNVSGHRIGTAEVESALVGHSAVAEAAVVPIPHEIKGEGIYAYVTVKTGVDTTDDLKKELVKEVRTAMGPIATPEYIHFADALPKTRSGKIMRRILKAVAEGHENVGDTSTLADPSVVDRLLKEHLLEEQRRLTRITLDAMEGLDHGIS